MARAKKCERCQKILRPHKLLQEVYQRFCLSNKANECTNEEGYEVAVGTEAAKGV